YTAFAITPMLVLAIQLAKMVFDKDTARERVIGQIGQLAGQEAVQAIQSVDRSAVQGNSVVTIIGIASIVAGALGVFIHIQDALNEIWRVQPLKNESWLITMKKRVFSLATVMATGFLLTVSLIISALLTWLGDHVLQRIGWPGGLLQFADFVFSFAVVTFLFAMLFKLLPDVKIRWRDVWIGAVTTSFLFNIGKWALGLYLAKVKASSSYGIAGPIFALLLWSYYASQIVFLGAEATHVYAVTRGGRDPDTIRDPNNPATHPIENQLVPPSENIPHRKSNPSSRTQKRTGLKPNVLRRTDDDTGGKHQQTT
ncbi:MAG TPA: YihY/virulence factor BrkB family protein, partial [Opitutaceae bacterium]|nr:YihY/virulence factor BrkB family protein [Opitutaceae bacterium]